jgi:hypothetical protein
MLSLHLKTRCCLQLLYLASLLHFESPASPPRWEFLQELHHCTQPVLQLMYVTYVRHEPEAPSLAMLLHCQWLFHIPSGVIPNCVTITALPADDNYCSTTSNTTTCKPSSTFRIPIQHCTHCKTTHTSSLLRIGLMLISTMLSRQMAYSLSDRLTADMTQPSQPGKRIKPPPRQQLHAKQGLHPTGRYGTH